MVNHMLDLGQSLVEVLLSIPVKIQELTPQDPISQLGIIAAWCSGILLGIIVTKLFLNKA